MRSQLGAFIRQLCKASKLSLQEVAKSAGIDRGTVSRWELDIQQPRSSELQAFLRVVGATPNDWRRAHILLGKPGLTVLKGKPTFLRIASHAAHLGPKPHGDMLKALRMRQGSSHDAVAICNGVTVRTLRRWENGDSWPDFKQLHSLCVAVGASLDEIIALTTENVAFESPCADMTHEEVFERCQELRFFFKVEGVTVALRELGFFALEARAWELAEASDAGRRLLSYVYSCHANYYSASMR